MVNRLLVAALAIAACSGCDPGRRSPFIGKATPELRASFAKVCANPVTGASDLETDSEAYGDSVAQSSGYGCRAQLYYDPQSLAIQWISMSAGTDWSRFRHFVRDTIIPLVKPRIGEWIEKNVVSDLGVDKHVTYSKRGQGEVEYRNRSRDGVDEDLRPTRTPGLDLNIRWK